MKISARTQKTSKRLLPSILISLAPYEKMFRRLKSRKFIIFNSETCSVDKIHQRTYYRPLKHAFVQLSIYVDQNDLERFFKHHKHGQEDIVSLNCLDL